MEHYRVSAYLRPVSAEVNNRTGPVVKGRAVVKVSGFIEAESIAGARLPYFQQVGLGSPLVLYGQLRAGRGGGYPYRSRYAYGRAGGHEKVPGHGVAGL